VWGTHTVRVARGADGTMEVTRMPIAPMPLELKQVIEEMK
jgi:hypothetical protein